MIEKSDKLPVYLQVQRFIEELIDGSDYGPGDHIPSERTLADQLNVNRLTVRKAIDRLVSNGRLERNSTNGTRIPEPRVNRSAEPNLSLGSLTRTIELRGGVPSNRLLHFELTKAREAIAGFLSIPVDADVVAIRRLWRVDDIPIIIETSYIPASTVPNLDAEDLTAGQSFYKILQERYGITPTSAKRTISVHTPTTFEQQTLMLPEHSSTLLMRLVTADADGKPIEYVRSVNHPVHVNFQTSSAVSS